MHRADVDRQRSKCRWSVSERGAERNGRMVDRPLRGGYRV